MTTGDDPCGAAAALWAEAQALNRAARAVSPSAGRLPPLLFITDPDRTPRPWETTARLPPGSGVVYRALGQPEALETARRLRATTAAGGVRLLIGLDDALARAVGADGLHLPERALGQARALRAAHPRWLLTGAVHAPAAVQGLEDGGGLDAVVVSPVFAPGGASAGRRPALGVEGFRRLAAPLPWPAYGLGGITAANAAALRGSGACGLAGVDGIVAAFGP